MNGTLLKRKPSSSKDLSSKGRQQASSYGITTEISCLHHSKAHIIPKCQEFKTIDLEQRVQTLLTKETCFICLKPGHHSNVLLKKKTNVRKEAVDRGTTPCCMDMTSRDSNLRSPRSHLKLSHRHPHSHWRSLVLVP